MYLSSGAEWRHKKLSIIIIHVRILRIMQTAFTFKKAFLLDGYILSSSWSVCRFWDDLLNRVSWQFYRPILRFIKIRCQHFFSRLQNLSDPKNNYLNRRRNYSNLKSCTKNIILRAQSKKASSIIFGKPIVSINLHKVPG